MAVTTTNLIKPISSGLDNLSINNYNNLQKTGGMVDYNNPSSIYPSQINLGISNIFSSSNINKSNIATKMEDEIQSLSKSVNTQEARIAAGAGSEIVSQYKADKQQDNENFIIKILNVLDAPRNALMNGFKYASSMGVGGFFEGFWQGLTREEEYTGYDFAEDLGITNPVANTIVGFTAEVFLDPLNWITWGGRSIC